jgi:hypothetical protein
LLSAGRRLRRSAGSRRLETSFAVLSWARGVIIESDSHGETLQIAVIRRRGPHHLPLATLLGQLAGLRLHVAHPENF